MTTTTDAKVISSSPGRNFVTLKIQTSSDLPGATDLSSVSMAAALHFDLCLPTFGVQEHRRYTAVADAVRPHAYTFDQGHLYPGEAIGLGVDIDEASQPSIRIDAPTCRSTALKTVRCTVGSGSVSCRAKRS